MLLVELPTIFERLAEQIAKNTILNGASMKLAGIMSAGCMGLAGVFFLIMLALNVFKISIGQSKEGFHFLWKYAALLILLLCYNTLMPIADIAISIPIMVMKEAVKTITDSGSTESVMNKKLQVADLAAATSNDAHHTAKPASSTIATAKATTDTPDTKVGDQADQLDAPEEAGFFAGMLKALISEAYGIILCVIILIQSYAISILYITGPVAITFSLLIGFEGGVAGWFKYYVVIKLWLLIVYVVQALSASIFVANLSNSSNVTGFQSLVMEAGLLVIYTMIPKFADILISGSQGGAFFSAAIAGASALASKLAKNPITAVPAAFKAGLKGKDEK